MSFVFSPEKATQAAAVLLKCAPDCRMSYMKLIKLLYIADRESLRETKSLITGDRPVAMRNGPVLSGVYDFIMQREVEGADVWGNYIETEGIEVRLIDDPGTMELCDYDVQKLTNVYHQHENESQWQLRDLTHSFEEWKRNDPGTSSRPIPIQHIIEAVGLKDEMDDILQERAESEYFSKLFDE